LHAVSFFEDALGARRRRLYGAPTTGRFVQVWSYGGLASVLLISIERFAVDEVVQPEEGRVQVTGTLELPAASVIGDTAPQPAGRFGKDMVNVPDVPMLTKNVTEEPVVGPNWNGGEALKGASVTLLSTPGADPLKLGLTFGLE